FKDFELGAARRISLHPLLGTGIVVHGRRRGMVAVPLVAAPPIYPPADQPARSRARPCSEGDEGNACRGEWVDRQHRYL
ncbi:hypothetical protein N7448_009912, partial [Penicillium atrosanguineum]